MGRVGCVNLHAQSSADAAEQNLPILILTERGMREKSGFGFTSLSFLADLRGALFPMVYFTARAAHPFFFCLATGDGVLSRGDTRRSR
jgi:hypothetical protein